MKFISAAVALFLLASPVVLAKKGDKQTSSEDVEIDSCLPTIAVANRASGSVSILDAEFGDVLKTVDLPGNAEPMYINAINGLVFIGDRAQNRIVVLDANQDYKVIKLMPGGNGIFHQCTDQAGTILWVNNDIDNTISIYDIVHLAAIKTIAIPADITAAGGKPHDLTVTFDGKKAYITCIGLDTEKGVLLEYDTATYELTARRNDLQADPHVSTTWRNNKIYVAQQGGGQQGGVGRVSILSAEDLTTIKDIPVDSAHGVTMTNGFDEYMYVSDISSAVDGQVGLYAIDFVSNELVGSLTEGVPPTPHNIVGTGQHIFVTHSGPTANLVTQYAVSKDHPSPHLVNTVEVGLNPFGLDFVETTCATSRII